jgi:hypothetical protein
LVISLELSQESVLLTIDLINSWIINNFSKHKMEKLIDKLFTIKETLFDTQIFHNKEVAGYGVLDNKITIQ